jgi:hypothetical protein
MAVGVLVWFAKPNGRRPLLFGLPNQMDDVHLIDPFGHLII